MDSIEEMAYLHFARSLPLERTSMRIRSVKPKDSSLNPSLSLKFSPPSVTDMPTAMVDIHEYSSTEIVLEIMLLKLFLSWWTTREISGWK